MPSLNFKKQFAPPVESGAKKSTFRRPRNDIQPGSRLCLFTGMRTRDCRHLGDTVCSAVTPVRITEEGMYVHALKIPAVIERQWAQADGFPDVESFRAFFRQQYGLPVDLVAIEWTELPLKRPGQPVKELTKSYNEK